MIIKLNYQDGTPAYEIRPHGNNLCWELYEWRQKQNKKDIGTDIETVYGWVFTGNYPTTIEYALKHIAEMALKQSVLTVDASELADAVKSTLQQFQTAVRLEIERVG